MNQSRTILWKRILALAIMGGALWLIFERAIRSRQEELRRLATETASLTERLGQVKRTIKGVKELEATLVRERARLRQAQNGLDGSAMLWMQEQLQEHFRDAGFPKAIIRLANTEDDAASPGFQRLHWTVGIKLEQTSAELRRLMHAAAQLESARVFKVSGLAALPDAENPDRKVAVVGLFANGRK